MKKLLFSFVLSFFVVSAFSQIIRNTSNSLSFQALEKTKISGISKPFSYNAVATITKVSKTSSVLYFGTASREVNVTSSNPVKAEQTPVVASQKEPVRENNVIQNNATLTVAEPKKVEPAVVTEAATSKTMQSGLKELGDEYAAAAPVYRALILGVSDYQFAGPGLPALVNPTSDASALYEALTKKYSFDPANVKYIKNPTRQQIIDTFEELASEVTEKENLLVFYAGHGYYDKEKELGYWLPSDAKPTSKSNWISNSTIKDYLSTIKSKHTLLITDACFGGSIFKTRAVDANNVLRVKELYRDPSRKAITSGNLTEVPDQSPFIQFLLKKLNENEDDFLPTQKLFSRIYEPVSTNSSATPQFGVIQGAGDEGGDFIFIKRK